MTDEKETELGSNRSDATTFYLKSAYDLVIIESLQNGRDEVIENPQNYLLTSNAAYNNVIAQRDARFADSDGDGLTDAKEQELNTDPGEQTTFYMKPSYDNAVAASRVAGRNDVTTNPQNYELKTTTAYQAIIAERNARFIDTDGDGLTDTKESELDTNHSEETTFYLQSFFDNAVANSLQSGRTEVTASPQNYDLTTIDSYEEMVDQRNARFVDSDQDGLTDIKERELSSDPNLATSFYLQGAYDTAVAEALQAGSDSVTNSPNSYNLTSSSAYDAVVAQRNARPTIAAYNTVLAERNTRFADTDEDGLTDMKERGLGTGLTVATSFYLQGAYDDAVVASEVLGRQAGQSEVTANPGVFNLTTVAAYNTVIAERDARFTEDQIRTMSVDHTAGQNEAGNMQVEIAFIQSADLNNYIPFTVPPDSLSVVDGKICMEFPPSDEQNFFFRFRLE